MQTGCANNLALANYPEYSARSQRERGNYRDERDVFASSLIIPALYVCVPRSVVYVIIKKRGRVYSVSARRKCCSWYERELQLTFTATGT